MKIPNLTYVCLIFVNSKQLSPFYKPNLFSATMFFINSDKNFHASFWKNSDKKIQNEIKNGFCAYRKI